MGIEQQLGFNIKSLRKARGISQEGLANQIEMSPAYLRSIERGTANPSVKALERIADGLEVSVGDLLQEADQDEGRDRDSC